MNLLESEAIYIFREVAAQFEKPVLLFSGGKDTGGNSLKTTMSLNAIEEYKFYACIGMKIY